MKCLECVPADFLELLIRAFSPSDAPVVGYCWLDGTWALSFWVGFCVGTLAYASSDVQAENLLEAASGTMLY